VFETEVKDADEAIGMEVNEPAQLFNVKSILKAENVRRAAGFSTNKGINSIIISCSCCHKIFPVVTTGPPPLIVKCPYCNSDNKLNI